MSRWRVESTYIGRYVGTGAFNTLVGFGVIFGLMWAGISPMVANAAGYACGFVLGFLLTKKFVFRSNGGLLGEGGRYVLSFLAAFLLNIAVLRVAIERLDMPAVVAQVISAATFTVAMYAMTRFYAFSPASHGVAQQPGGAKAALTVFAAFAAFIIVPIGLAFYVGMGALPFSLRLLSAVLAMLVVSLGAIILRHSFRQLGKAGYWLLGATLVFSLALLGSAPVKLKSADFAQVGYSDGTRAERVMPSPLSAAGRDIGGFGMHPAYGEAVVPNSLTATFLSQPKRIEVLFAKPREAMVTADGTPTDSDGISVELRTFDSKGQPGQTDKFILSEESFRRGWIERPLRHDGGIASVSVSLGLGPPGGTPNFDSTLVGFQVPSWPAHIVSIGTAWLVGLGFFVVALFLVLNLRMLAGQAVVRPRGVTLMTLALCGVVFVCLCALAYISHSKTEYVYFWDYRNYWEKTEILFGMIAGGSWRDAVRLFATTYSANYSMLPAVAPALLGLVTGYPTRINYVLGITALYAVPAYIVVSYLGRRMADGVAPVVGAKRSGWVLASFPVLVGLPAYFGTTLYLMPDIGGVVLAVSALLCASTLVGAIGEPAGKEARWRASGHLVRSSVSLGVLFSLMFIFRRWYVFFAAGISATLFAFVVFEIWRARTNRLDVLARSVTAATLMVFSTMPLLCWVLFVWSRDLGMHDYSKLYASYRYSLGQDAQIFKSLFGVAAPILCLVGGALLYWFGKDRRLLLMVTASTLIAAALFLRVQSPGHHHFYLLMPMLGAFLAGLCILLARRYGLMASVALTLVLILGAGLGTRPMSQKYGITMFAGFDEWESRHQEHAAGLAEISRWLEAPENADRKFCLIASSVASFFGSDEDHGVSINQSLFAELWQILPNVEKYGYDQRMIRLGQVDSLEGAPTPRIVECEIFLVGVPFQSHLPPGQQDTLGIVQKDMVDGTGIGAAVDRNPRIFAMGAGVEILGYRTVRAITSQEYDDLVRRFNENEARPQVRPD